MVGAEELAVILEGERKKYTDPRVAGNFKGWNKTMQYHFTDTDQYWVIRLVNGEPQTAQKLEGPAEKPEIQYDMDTDTLRAMSRGELSGMEAFQQKRLRMKASMPDMMKLQALNRI
jgi:putative sterol carrier protein